MKDTREMIMETAYSLFIQSGYNAVTMNDIVTQTGLSKGAFYHHFNSKEQLFEEVLNHVFFGDFSRDYANMPEVSLKRFMEEELDVVKRRHHSLMDALPDDDKYTPINYYTLIFDALRMFPAFKARFETFKNDRVGAWTRVIKAARQKKEIRTETSDKDLAMMFLYLNQGISLSFIMGNNLRMKYKEIGALWNAIYNMVKA